MLKNNDFLNSVIKLFKGKKLYRCKCDLSIILDYNSTLKLLDAVGKNDFNSIYIDLDKGYQIVSTVVIGDKLKLFVEGVNGSNALFKEHSTDILLIPKFNTPSNMIKHFVYETDFQDCFILENKAINEESIFKNFS